MNNQVYVMGFTDKDLTLLRYALAKAGHTAFSKERANEYWDLFKRVCVTQEFGSDDEIIEALEGVR